MKVVGSMGCVGSWFWISATSRVMKSLGFRPLVDAEELVELAAAAAVAIAGRRRVVRVKTIDYHRVSFSFGPG